MILVGVYKEIFEVSKFICKHPGEGIKNIYLREFNRCESTEEFNMTHSTDEADEMMINAKKLGFDDETGIYYVCPYFFKKKMPKYFKFFPNDPYCVDFLKNQNTNTFVIRRSNSNTQNSLCVTYKNDKGEINQLKLRKTDEKWYTQWENDEGDVIDVGEENVEDLINSVMISNGYIGCDKNN